MTNRLFLVSFPREEDSALHWWSVEDGSILAKGCDQDPLTAAEIANPDNSILIIALVPSSLTVIRWHVSPEGVTDKQELAAAIMDAKLQSLHPDELHVTAAKDQDRVLSVSLSKILMEGGLSHLQSLGLDPDLIIPSGCLFDASENKILIADMGCDRLLRGPKLIAADEPLAREYLVGTETVETLEKSDIDRAIASSDFASYPNLRTGPFAKKTKRYISDGEKRILTWLVAALLFVMISIPVVQLYKYQSAANTADETAMEAAQKIIGPVENLDLAEQRLDQKLLSENLGNNRLTVPLAGLFSSLQQVPGVSISRLSYGNNGLISLELTAVRNEDINPVLIAIQDQGFVITATPRQDASGFAKADVTVRVP